MHDNFLCIKPDSWNQNHRICERSDPGVEAPLRSAASKAMVGLQRSGNCPRKDHCFVSCGQKRSHEATFTRNIPVPT